MACIKLLIDKEAHLDVDPNLEGLIHDVEARRGGRASILSQEQLMKAIPHR